MSDLRQGEERNEHFLDELFNPVESVAIKMIPIREGSCQDRWVWQLTTKGNFTATSAYHVQISAKQLRTSSSSSSSLGVSKKTWKGLWSSALMPKIKNFL